MTLKTMLAATALGLAVAGGAAQAKEWKSVRIAVEGVYPPFNYMDKGELTGFDVDVAKTLCTHMKVECTFVVQDWDGMIPGLLAGKYDAIASSMSITDERKKKVDFSDKYYNTPAHFMAATTSKVGDTSPKGLAGKTIGAQGSTTQASFLDKNYKDSTVKTYQSVDDASADLASGRVDLVFSDKVLLNEWMKKSSDGKCCELVGPDMSDPKDFGYGKGVAVRKDAPELLAMFNTAIKASLADGSYKADNDKYFPFSVY
ncbi:transporter substrate-binding domain-containing protein [Lichenihabitans sp. Uapishka_5]|uniref:transporter substrate-binding domain-containing protein n=1 Tax=Lichenihabitans sp. Uapishka_5 TaxID=3037302 RepID=UPI0029E7F5FD|nr:transporter substrate-binding domain-containing protein [Lichenihabitans sp. Uapishka_5]MDX7952562.1 transporter substrate-binding domain-containing protein [Lichenihabitans sp. Uapishka_5]